MAMLVSLEEAKKAIRVTHDADDAVIELMISAASGAVLNYLKAIGSESMRDSAGELIVDSAGLVQDVDPVVKQATNLLTGYFYKDRDNDEGKEWEPSFLPRPVTALLYPLRDPAVA